MARQKKGRILNCVVCNVEFYATLSRIKKGGKFCSIKCNSIFKIAHPKNHNDNCIVCNKEIHLKPFHKKRYKGPFTCSRVCRGIFLKQHYLGENNPNHKFKDKLLKFFTARCVAIRGRANREKLNFDLTSEFLLNLYNEQFGMCYYTNIPMKISTTDFKSRGQAELDVLSVDKIIPELGYLQSNVRLCCSAINKLKGNAEKEELHFFIKNIIKNYKEELYD